jgi:hypothetical protein
MIEIPDIPGADTVVAHFGYWPTFHDAEVNRFSCIARRPSRIVVKAFHMTGEFEIIKRATVTFLLDGIVDGTTLLEGFNHQNVVAGLFVNSVAEGFEVALEWCFGVAERSPALACASKSSPTSDHFPSSNATSVFRSRTYNFVPASTGGVQRELLHHLRFRQHLAPLWRQNRQREIPVLIQHDHLPVRRPPYSPFEN